MQNQIKPTERELIIRNYSPKTIKSYLYGLKEYFDFKKKEDRFWSKMKFEPIFFCRAGGSDPFGPACRQAGWTISKFPNQIFRVK
jgi:hypothetical protein